MNDVSIYSNGKLHILKGENVLFLRGLRSYTLVTLTNGDVLKVSKNLKTTMESFNASSLFLRVHKSYCLNVSFIKSIYYSQDKLKASLNNKVEIPVTLYTMHGLRLLIGTKKNSNNNYLMMN